MNNRYRWIILLLSWLGLFMVGVIWYAVAPIIGILMDELNIVYVEAGILLAAPPLAYVTVGIAGGILGDRIGARAAIGVATIVMGALILVAGFSTNLATLSVCMFLEGVGLVIFITNGPRMVGAWFPPEYLGTAIGIWNTGFAAGSFVPLALTMSIFFPLFGVWRAIFFFYGALTLIVATFWWGLARNPRKIQDTNIDISALQGLFRVVKNRDLWLLCGLFFCVAGGFIGISSWLPRLLELKGITPSDAGFITSIMPIGNILGSIITPMISDRVGLRKPFLSILSLFLGLSIFSAGITLPPLLLVSVFIVGYCVGSLYVLIFAMPLELSGIGPKLAGSATGLLVTFSYSAATIEPILAGFLKDATGSFLSGVIMFAVVVEVGVIPSLYLAETGRERRK